MLPPCHPLCHASCWRPRVNSMFLFISKPSATRLPDVLCEFIHLHAGVDRDARASILPCQQVPKKSTSPHTLPFCNTLPYIRRPVAFVTLSCFWRKEGIFCVSCNLVALLLGSRLESACLSVLFVILIFGSRMRRHTGCARNGKRCERSTCVLGIWCSQTEFPNRSLHNGSQPC